MSNQTITFPICSIVDADTGLITAFIADDYATVTQGSDMDQVRQRLVTARNLIDQARKKYGFEKPSVEKLNLKNAGFKNEELTYQVVA